MMTGQKVRRNNNSSSGATRLTAGPDGHDDRLWESLMIGDDVQRGALAAE
jgi:hypothetical protein